MSSKGLWVSPTEFVRFSEPAAGKANLNIFAMARDGLNGAVHSAFAKALRQQTTVTLNALRTGAGRR